jgi:hypothetical protein
VRIGAIGRECYRSCIGGLLDFGRFITGFRKRRHGTLSSCHVTAECGVQNEKLSRLAEAVEAGKKLAQIYAD